MSYSKDGKTFKDLNLDTYVTKKFDKKNFKEITFSSHPSFISKRNAAFIVGQGVVDDVDKENFIIKMSTDFKSVEVIPLNSAVEKLDSGAKDIFVETIINYDYETGEILLEGSYTNASDDLTPFYLISTKGNTYTAYAFPSNKCNTIDRVGKYLVCYNYFEFESDESGVGIYYYSKDGKKWSKATTPKNADGLSWKRHYLFSEYFNVCVNEDSSKTLDSYTVYYTKDMKKYDSLSKDFVVDGIGRYMNFFDEDDFYMAIENGYGDKRQVAISKKDKKSGSKWKELFRYNAESNDLYYTVYHYLKNTPMLMKDGDKCKLVYLENGKEYDTKLEADKLTDSDQSYDNKTTYMVYKNEYIIATQNNFLKYYMIKTPLKFNYCRTLKTKSTGERLYIYNDTEIYYVSKSNIDKAVK